jgi:anti-sigma-K factor RskA
VPPQGDQNSDTGHVPVFGTWRNIYAAVIIVIVLMIAFVFAFSRFPY